MLSYLTAFIFYTFAMVGVLLIAFVVYKKFNFQIKQDNRGLINIVDSCPIGPKKTLLVVKIGNEKFLIASGIEHTTFLAKLDNNVQQIIQDVVAEEKPAQEISAPQMTKRTEEKDIYDFLYSQSKKIEKEKTNYKSENNLNNDESKLKELYMNNLQNNASSVIDSRKKLMQELLDEIHQNKAKIGSKF